MQFEALIVALQHVNTRLSLQAARQADQLLTFRNWLFGLYIVEFEQNGHDRAAYGQQLLKRLSAELKQRGLKGTSDRMLRQYRQFYLTYPQIWQSLTAKLQLADKELFMSLPEPALSTRQPECVFRPVYSEILIIALTQQQDVRALAFSMIGTGFIELSELLTLLSR